MNVYSHEIVLNQRSIFFSLLSNSIEKHNMVLNIEYRM